MNFFERNIDAILFLFVICIVTTLFLINWKEINTYTPIKLVSVYFSGIICVYSSPYIAFWIISLINRISHHY